MKKIDFNVNPKSYKHWKIEIEEKFRLNWYVLRPAKLKDYGRFCIHNK